MTNPEPHLGSIKVSSAIDNSNATDLIAVSFEGTNFQVGHAPAFGTSHNHVRR
jgi:hypothetical protein